MTPTEQLFFFFWLYNTSIGLENNHKNEEANKKQDEILHKINELNEKVDYFIGKMNYDEQLWFARYIDYPIFCSPTPK